MASPIGTLELNFPNDGMYQMSKYADSDEDAKTDVPNEHSQEASVNESESERRSPAGSVAGDLAGFEGWEARPPPGLCLPCGDNFQLGEPTMLPLPLDAFLERLGEGDADDEGSQVSGEVSLLDLPSIGSAGHFNGTCDRCCFHPKGRCLNGYNCDHCHFDHEKRKRKSSKKKKAELAEAALQASAGTDRPAAETEEAPSKLTILDLLGARMAALGSDQSTTGSLALDTERTSVSTGARSSASSTPKDGSISPPPGLAAPIPQVSTPPLTAVAQAPANHKQLLRQKDQRIAELEAENAQLRKLVLKYGSVEAPQPQPAQQIPQQPTKKPAAEAPKAAQSKAAQSSPTAQQGRTSLREALSAKATPFVPFQNKAPVFVHTFEPLGFDASGLASAPAF